MSANNQKIAQTAYRIWEQNGRPHGQDLDHWLAAEAEVKGGAKAAAPAKAPKAAKVAKPAAAKANGAAKPKAAKASATA